MKKIRRIAGFIILVECLILIGLFHAGRTIPVNRSVVNIDREVQNMTIEEKVAQMFMVHVPQENAVEIQQAYRFGGYILYSDAFEGKGEEEVVNNIQELQRVSTIPVLVSVEEEGGTRSCVSPFFKGVPFGSPQEVYQTGGMVAIINDVKEKDVFLQSFGINVNMAPVAIVSMQPEEHMYSRTIGQNARETSDYVRKVVQTMKQDAMGSVVKYFPGYNQTTDCVVGTHSYETLMQEDFLPFIEAIEMGADSIMVSHITMECLDSIYPSSLSSEVHRILREELGYHGVIITEELMLQGLQSFGTSEEIAVQAVLAGNDMLLSSDPIVQYHAILQAVKEGRIEESQIDASVTRILQWKQNIGIL